MKKTHHLVNFVNGYTAQVYCIGINKAIILAKYQLILSGGDLDLVATLTNLDTGQEFKVEECEPIFTEV